MELLKHKLVLRRQKKKTRLELKGHLKVESQCKQKFYFSK